MVRDQKFSTSSHEDPVSSRPKRSGPEVSLHDDPVSSNARQISSKIIDARPEFVRAGREKNLARGAGVGAYFLGIRFLLSRGRRRPRLPATAQGDGVRLKESEVGQLV
jgi:hypothetical protein